MWEFQVYCYYRKWWDSTVQVREVCHLKIKHFTMLKQYYKLHGIPLIRIYQPESNVNSLMCDPLHLGNILIRSIKSVVRWDSDLLMQLRFNKNLARRSSKRFNGKIGYGRRQLFEQDFSDRIKHIQFQSFWSVVGCWLLHHWLHQSAGCYPIISCWWVGLYWPSKTDHMAQTEYNLWQGKFIQKLTCHKEHQY